ncbi:MAG: hypothetical protein ACWGQW_17775, partial [bacterium]
MEKKSRIRICENCGTKVLPTQKELCPACQNRFKSPFETKPSIDIAPEQGFSWMPFLLLAGIVTLAD